MWRLFFKNYTMEFLENLEAYHPDYYESYEEWEHMSRAERRARRKARKDARQRRKQDMLDAEAEAKDSGKARKRMAKISKKQAKKLKKIYGDMTPEEIQQLNEINPLVPEMQKQVEEAGGTIENPDDPIEVAAKFDETVLQNEQTAQVDEVTQGESYEAFFGGNESFEHMSDDKKKKMRGFFKNAFGFIKGGISSVMQQAQDKQLEGQPLTEAEKAVLKLKAESAPYIADEKKSAISKALRAYIPIAAVVLIAYLLFKKK